MRTGLSCSSATVTIVRKFSSRRLPPTFPGLMRYLSSARAQAGILREQQVAVVVKVADDRHVDAAVRQARDDFRNRRCRRLVVHGDAHQLRPGPRERRDLIRGADRVGGVRVRHRLHDDRMRDPIGTPPTKAVTVCLRVRRPRPLRSLVLSKSTGPRHAELP